MSNLINQNKVNLILKEFEAGKIESALKKIRKYLKANPHDYNTRYNYALMSQKAGNIEEAIKNYNEVILNDDNNWRALTNLYLIFFDQEKYKQGLVLVNKILSILPNHQPTLRDKAHLQYYLGDLEEAQNNVILSIKLNPKDYIALNILGMIYDKMGSYDLAKNTYLKVLEFNKDYYPTYSNLGKCYLEIKEIEEAINILKEGLKINPEFINAKNNLANAYYQLEMYDKALKLYKEILEKYPNHKDVNSNIALCYFYAKNFEQTEKYFSITKKIDGENKNFRKNYAHYLLFKQEYKEAWEIYWDSRLRIDDYYRSDSWKYKILQHIYMGNILNNNDKILIIKEQGIGDEILYSTMYPDLIKIFPNCTIETEPRLISLFNRSYNTDNNIVPFLKITGTDNDFLKYDKIICAGSLGKFFRNTLDSFPKINKLTPKKSDIEFVQKKLNNFKSVKKIGISWKSKRRFYGEGKSLDLSDLNEILKLKNSIFINLQYGDTLSDQNNLEQKHNIKITTLTEIDLMNDFEKLSALLCSLDLFVTVSNSTAHLAGALNVPTILIKPKSFAIFHYWNQPNSITPWYSSIELIDQGDNKEKLLEKLKIKINEKLNL